MSSTAQPYTSAIRQVVSPCNCYPLRELKEQFNHVDMLGKKCEWYVQQGALPFDTPEGRAMGAEYADPSFTEAYRDAQADLEKAIATYNKQVRTCALKVRPSVVLLLHNPEERKITRHVAYHEARRMLDDATNNQTPFITITCPNCDHHWGVVA